MIRAGLFRSDRALVLAGCVASLAALSSCGGGATGSVANSGADKTYLSVQASDADGDTLHYQWRVTAGSVDNKDSSQTVWTMPAGRGIHFAYVTVSDGKGGWVEQQYAVSTDEIISDPPVHAPVSRVAPTVNEPAAVAAGSAGRIRLQSADSTRFMPAGGGTAMARTVFLPDVQVQLLDHDTKEPAFAGTTDLSGELDLPKLTNGKTYDVRCTTQNGAPLGDCGSFGVSSDAAVHYVLPSLSTAQNLRLYGHIALADGGVCGHESAFFDISTAATVQVQQADGTVLGTPVHVNRYGDYQVSAAVPVKGSLKLAVACEGYTASLAVPASTDPSGYVSSVPIELSHTITNSKPQIVKMVASGSDGNVRGRMIVPGQGSGSGTFPGASHYLTYKGVDTKLSACLYYRALGAVKDCDSQGNPSEPISFSDWKTQNGFGSASDVSATYVNQRDLNLVRQMTATRSASGGIAFYVCNAPGPDGTTQAEVDQIVGDALSNKNRVACVAMEYTTVTGANGGQPLTKFFTFGPEGDLLLSINLDGRGEKFMPGSCVACHGGTTYNGRFPEQQTASPYLGARFLPFDTDNYLFSSNPSLAEPAQEEAFYQLNQLVRATEPSDTTPTSTLIQGWYASSHVLDKAYVPPNWKAADGQPGTAGASTFYLNVVAISCRTCHVSLAPKFDWNNIVLSPARAGTQFCGGTADVSVNASMPNALISSDRLFTRIQSDAALATLVTQFLGCSAPQPDPVYASH